MMSNVNNSNNNLEKCLNSNKKLLVYSKLAACWDVEQVLGLTWLDKYWAHVLLISSSQKHFQKQRKENANVQCISHNDGSASLFLISKLHFVLWKFCLMELKNKKTKVNTWCVYLDLFNGKKKKCHVLFMLYLLILICCISCTCC